MKTSAFTIATGLREKAPSLGPCIEETTRSRTKYRLPWRMASESLAYGDLLRSTRWSRFRTAFSL